MDKSLIDLTNIKSVTGGDLEIEKLLLEEFINSSNKIIDDLKSNHENDNLKDLKVAAHSLRGICMNINAMTVVDLCTTIENDESESKEGREGIINKILEEHSSITSYIKDNHL